MKIGEVEKSLANFYDKNEYVINTRNLKQALNHGLVLKKVHRFFKLTKNEVFEKTMENVRKYRTPTSL